MYTEWEMCKGLRLCSLELFLLQVCVNFEWYGGFDIFLHGCEVSRPSLYPPVMLWKNMILWWYIIHSVNPLNPDIKIEILIYCPYTIQ